MLLVGFSKHLHPNFIFSNHDFFSCSYKCQLSIFLSSSLEVCAISHKIIMYAANQSLYILTFLLYLHGYKQSACEAK